MKLSRAEIYALKDMTPDRPYYWKPKTMVKLRSKGLVDDGHDFYYGTFFKINEAGRKALEEYQDEKQ